MTWVCLTVDCAQSNKIRLPLNFRVLTAIAASPRDTGEQKRVKCTLTPCLYSQGAHSCTADPLSPPPFVLSQHSPGLESLTGAQQSSCPWTDPHADTLCRFLCRVLRRSTTFPLNARLFPFRVWPFRRAVGRCANRLKTLLFVNANVHWDLQFIK